MPKFSISTLLWSVSVFAVIIGVVIAQRTLSEREALLAAAKQENSTYRNELGMLEVPDSEQYYIRHFKDRYTSDREFRWRIHLPDAANCKIFYAVGRLPVDGMPSSKRAIQPNGLLKGPVELVLVVESHEIREGGPWNFEAKCFHELENSRTTEFFKAQPAGWLPWLGDLGCTYENPPLDTTTQFDLDEPFVIMKHYTTNDSGELIGYMFWVDRNSTNPSLN